MKRNLEVKMEENTKEVIEEVDTDLDDSAGGIVNGLIGEDFDKFKTMEDPDVKEFLNVMKSMEIRSIINNLRHQHQEMQNKLLYMLPMGVEESKIIMARLANISDEVIDGLSEEEITKIITIDGTVAGAFREPPDGSSVEYKRDVLKLISATKGELEERDEVLALLEDRYKEITDSHIESILQRRDFDQYVIDYYNKQIERDDVSPKVKENMLLTKNVLEYSRTLEPIKQSIHNQLVERGAKSLLEGFKSRKVDMMESATEALSAYGMKYPFQLMMNLEELLFGEDYAEYNNLFIYLLARYIHYSEDIQLAKEVPFISTLITNLVMICREYDTLDPEFVESRVHAIRDILDEIIAMAN